MKIMLITGRADTGGGPEHVLQLLRQLAPRYSLVVAAPKDAPYWDRYELEVGTENMFELPHRKFSVRSLFLLIGFIRDRKVSLIHSHGRAGGVYARLAKLFCKCPVVHTPNGPIVLTWPLMPFTWLIEYIFAWMSDAIIAVSRSERDFFAKSYFCSSKLKIVPNGVSVPSENRVCVIPESRPFRILHATRFVPQKYTELLLDICVELLKKLPDETISFELYGDGPGMQEFRHKLNDLGLVKHFVLYGPVASLTDRMQGGLCYLSTSRWEGLPIAVLESLSYGLPVIATATPGNTDAISEDTGMLFSIDSPKTAAEAIVSLISNPEVWQEKSRNGRESAVERYAIEAMATSIETIYKKFIFLPK